MNSSLRKFLIPAVVIVLLGGLLAALLTPQAPANTSTAGVSGKEIGRASCRERV